MTTSRLSFALVLSVASLVLAQAQTAPIPAPNAPPDTGAGKPLIIDYADTYERIVTDSGAVVQRLEGEVELRQDSAFIYCDEAEIFDDDLVRARGNVVVLQNDTISTFADSLEYFADTEIAYLYGNVVLVNGRQQLFTDSLRYDLAGKRATYTSRAKLTDGEAQLSSLRGSYDVEARYARFADSVFVVRPDFNLISDTLGFATEARVVYFEGPTVMATPQSRIYCEDGFYRLADTTGRFSVNAQVARGTQRAMADTIWYYGLDDRFVLQGDARFTDGTQRARGGVITYDERANRTVLEGDAVFVDGEQRVAGDRIDYDGATRQFESRGQIRISEPPFLLDADSLTYDDATGTALVRGNVLWRDTLTRRSIRAARVDYRAAGDYVLAYGGRPTFAIVLEGDSLFLRADTLLTYRETNPAILVARTDSLARARLDDSLRVLDSVALARAVPDGDSLSRDIAVAASLNSPDTLAGLAPLAMGDTTTTLTPAVAARARLPDSVRYLRAYRDVRVYKSDLQALCDSLVYVDLDSTFTLYHAPIMWSDTSQFVADTVRIRLRDERIDRVALRSNAFIVNSGDERFFNQIKGRQVDVDFVASEVDRMLVRGNAESVYYILDEQRAYIGVNHVKSARMRMHFADSQISDIYFYDSPSGDITPLAPRGQEPKLLDDFRWEVEARPKSKSDL